MSEPLEAPKRKIEEPEDHGWAGSELSEDDYVDDRWIAENVKVVEDNGLDESDSSESS